MLYVIALRRLQAKQGMLNRYGCCVWTAPAPCLQTGDFLEDEE